jgi:antitoxin VapB
LGFEARRIAAGASPGRVYTEGLAIWARHTAYLVVKSEEAERLAAEIARETGQSITVAVTEALRERAARIPRREGEGAALERLRAAAKRISSRIHGPAVDHGELLYDEYGLPK